MSKVEEPMNWTKKQTQHYGAFLAILGFILGCIVTYGIIILIQTN